jgi:hypothetical protein
MKGQGMTAVMTPDKSFTERADAMLKALRAAEKDTEGWAKRSDIGKALHGKKAGLSAADVLLLDFLIERGDVEVREVETYAPSKTRKEYRVKP